MSAASISFPAGMVMAIVAAVWQAPYYFVTVEAATVQHKALESQQDDIKTAITQVYLELSIGTANTEMGYMEREGIITDQQRRHYDLLQFSVQDMTKKLMESRQ